MMYNVYNSVIIVANDVYYNEYTRYIVIYKVNVYGDLVKGITHVLRRKLYIIYIYIDICNSIYIERT